MGMAVALRLAMASLDASQSLPLPGFPAPPQQVQAPLRRARPALRRRAGWAVALLTLAALGVAGLLWLRAPEAPPISYQTRVLDRGPIVARITASGTLSALVSVNVGSQVSGRIAALHADFGSRVSEGQIVATLDPAFFRAAVAQAKANHTVATAAVARAAAERLNAERQWARARALAAEGVSTRADLDAAEAAVAVAAANEASARAGVEQARALLDQAKLNLRYTTIASPISGVVISRNVDVGQTVAATLQAPVLFTIAQDLAHMQVDTSIAEADIGKLQPGMAARFSVDAYPGRSFEGRIRQIRDNAQSVQNVVTYNAVIDVNNVGLLLKPGMTANVTVEYQRRDTALRVPNAALRFRPDLATRTLIERQGGSALGVSVGVGERLLWLLQDGHAHARLIRVGISDGTWTEVTGGDVLPGSIAIVDAVARERAP